MEQLQLFDPNNPDDDNRDIRPNPKVEQWHRDYQTYAQDRHPFNPSKLIIDGPTSQPVETLPENDFNRLFFQIMAQGVAPDPDSNRPHFFHPKTFLQETDHKINKGRFSKKFDPFRILANGLNSIALFKNLPENQADPTIQQEAKAAIDEYLDPELFENNYTLDDELIEIYARLDPEVRKDKMINDCLIAADQQREQLKTDRNQREKEHSTINTKELQTRGQKTKYQDIYTPNPESFQVDPDTTIDDVLANLKNSPNQAAFERINALKKWGDFIQSRLGDINYEEEIISFGTNPHTRKRSKYTNDNTYVVIAFDYAGRRCMIAESCGSGGAKSTSAAMKIWRSEPEDLGDKQGWMRAFAQSKTAASEQSHLRSLNHAGLTDAINQRGTSDENHIPEEEDRLFRLAMHYFEIGEFLGGGEEAVKAMGKTIGPEFRRPNPAPGLDITTTNNPQN